MVVTNHKSWEAVFMTPSKTPKHPLKWIFWTTTKKPSSPRFWVCPKSYYYFLVINKKKWSSPRNALIWLEEKHLVVQWYKPQTCSWFFVSFFLTKEIYVSKGFSYSFYLLPKTSKISFLRIDLPPYIWNWVVVNNKDLHRMAVKEGVFSPTTVDPLMAFMANGVCTNRYFSSTKSAKKYDAVQYFSLCSLSSSKSGQSLFFKTEVTF